MVADKRMRKALEFIKDVVSGEDGKYVWKTSFHPSDSNALDAIYNEAKEALENPPKLRNCDRFQTEEVARAAYLREVWDIRLKYTSLYPFEGWTEQMKERYATWLMENAKGDTQWKGRDEDYPLRECEYPAFRKGGSEETLADPSELQVTGSGDSSPRHSRTRP